MITDKVIARIPRASDGQVVATSTANASVAITLAAPDSKFRWVIYGFTASASAAPAATVALTLTTNAGATELEKIQLPAAVAAPIFSNQVYVGAAGGNVVLTLPALGGSTIGSISIRAAQVPVTSL